MFDISPFKLHDELMELVNKKLKRVAAQREEILEAFIAKYGFEPDQIVQVIQRFPDGSEKFFVRQRTQEELEMLSRMSSQL